MFHDDLKGSYFLFGVTDEFSLPVSKNAAVFHAPGTGHFFILITQYLICAEIDANIRVLSQDRDLFTQLCPVHVNHIVMETEIHWDHIGPAFSINHCDMAPGTTPDDFKDPGILCDGAGTHNYKDLTEQGLINFLDFTCRFDFNTEFVQISRPGIIFGDKYTLESELLSF